MEKKVLAKDAAILVLANALTCTLTYILTLRSVAKTLNKQAERQKDRVRLAFTDGEKRDGNKDKDEDVKTLDGRVDVVERVSAHPGRYA